MSKIRILSDALASQVAAGEVVERPAAVVRELVENSLDAKAKHIEVHVQRGGSSLIKIIDDGSGMDREDALLCLERHATSKIHTKEDLAAIYTFGFRGEALPSIASVSRFRLTTRQTDALSGTEIEVHGGKMMSVKDAGSAGGTVIEVRNLFFNVPARRKFLRTENTEYSHVEQQFRLHAIAHPEVTFTLTRNGEVVFHLPATGDVLERIRGLSGNDVASRLIPVPREERRGITVWGYIGGPGVSRSSRQTQLSFLNGRPIQSPAITYGLREGYHTVLMKGQHPVTFLFLEMDAHAYDVNVHPAKKEVRFHDGISVREVVAHTVHTALTAARTIPTGHGALPSRPTSPPAHDSPQTAAAERPWQLHTQTTTPPSPSQTFLPIRPSVQPTPTAVPPAAPVAAVHPQAASDLPQKAPTENYRILGVLHRLYVMMEGPDGLVMMDQHAAHERVMFEKMRRSMEAGGVPTQRLLMPVMLEVNPKEADLLNRNLDSLARLGIEAEPFGPNTFKIEALPTFLKTDDPVQWLDQVIEELRGMAPGASNLRLGEDMIATTVCRHSVKANDRLSLPELTALLEDLFRCDMPYCCPHGRPTLIQISKAELERKFGRRAPH